MSRRALTLSFRVLSEARRTQSPWICRRCFATEATEPAVAQVPPPAPPSTTPSPIEAAPEQPPAEQKFSDKQRDVRRAAIKRLRFLRTELPHDVPFHYLQHCLPEALTKSELKQRANIKAHGAITGIVVSAGKMQKTVKVRVAGKRWNSRIGKYFDSYKQHLVHDPKSSLIVGDVVSLHRLRSAPNVHHIVAAIIAPFEKAIAERPRVPSPEERLNDYKRERFAKLRRRELRTKEGEQPVQTVQGLGEKGPAPMQGQSESKSSTTKNKSARKAAASVAGTEDELPQVKPRGKRNKEKAMKQNAKAEERLLEAKAKGEALEAEGLDADSVLSGKK